MAGVLKPFQIPGLWDQPKSKRAQHVLDFAKANNCFVAEFGWRDHSLEPEEGETIAGGTYGGMRLVQEMANARFIVKSRLFEKVTLRSLGYFILEMSKQFINKDRMRRIIGDSGEAQESVLEAGKLKAIKGMFDIKVIPNSSMVIDQQAEAVKLNSLADRFMR